MAHKNDTLQEFIDDKSKAEKDLYDILKSFANKYPQWDIVDLHLGSVTNGAGRQIVVNCLLEVVVISA